MADSQDLTRTVQEAFGLILNCLASDPVPDSFDQQVILYAELRSRLGAARVAEQLSLQPDELALLNKVVAEVDRRSKRTSDSDGAESRNATIAQLRLVSWFETIAQRKPEVELSNDLDVTSGEDLSRKRVRALELVLRSLVGERHGDQAALIEHMRTLFGDRVVDTWLGVADPGDILSGTLFSELASLFVDKEEFTHHERLYEQTPFLTLLREKRRTIQTFLEDIRRIRNALAHNRQISPVQLELLDIYYDELMTPIAESHEKGETSVDPSRYLDVSKADLNEYFSNLGDDVMSVKDDIAELKCELGQRLDAVSGQAAEIQQTTTGIKRRLAWACVAIAVVAIVGAFGIYQNWGVEKDLADIGESVEQLEEDTGDLAEVTADIESQTERVESTTERIEETTGRIESEAENIAETTGEIAKTTEELEASGRRVEENTAATRDAIGDLTEITKSVDTKTANIEKATREMEATGKRVEEETAKIRDAVVDVARNSDRVVASLDQIRDGFQSLVKSGGVIPDPKTPQEVYHNARVYEQEGNYGKARQSYVRFFSFDLDLVDPHLRYQTFLKLQEGRQGALEMYNELRLRSKSFVTEYAALLLLPREARVRRLTKFAENHADFAPVYYELSRDFSEARLGDQAMSDKASELEYLRKFLEKHGEGKYLRFMLDQEVADAQLEDARERLEALKGLNVAALNNPVTLTVNGGTGAAWRVNFHIVGQAKEIFYSMARDGEYTSTGHLGVTDNQTGFAVPNTSVELGGDAAPAKLYVKFADVRDRMQGPYELPFDPEAKLFQFVKRQLEQQPNSWVSFRDFNGNTLFYITHLMTFRVALEEVRYGLDTEELNQVYRFPPADPENPISVGEDVIMACMIDVPGTTKFASLQLKYKDGTVSKVQRFIR